MEEKLTILYVDDEVNNQHSFRARFRREFNVVTASSGKEGLDMLRDNDMIDIIVSDYDMPGMTGVCFLTQTRRTHCHSVRILTSVHFSSEVIAGATNEAAVHALLNKPWDEEELSEAIRSTNAVYRQGSMTMS